jgi:hypothetical protein
MTVEQLVNILAPMRSTRWPDRWWGDAGRDRTHFQGWKCVQAALSWKSQTQPDGLGSMARDMRGSGGSSVANLDSRNPQIGSFFCPLCEEAGRAGKTGCALGSHCGATTNDQFRGFFGTCEIVSPELSNPRVAGSSPAGRSFFDGIRSSLVIAAPQPAGDMLPLPKSHGRDGARGCPCSGRRRC